MSELEIPGRRDSQELRTDTTVLGLEVLDKIQSLDGAEKLKLISALVSAFSYEVIGEEYDSEETGQVLDSLQAAQLKIEQSNRSRQWKAEELERRANDILDN